MDTAQNVSKDKIGKLRKSARLGTIKLNGTLYAFREKQPPAPSDLAAEINQLTVSKKKIPGRAYQNVAGKRTNSQSVDKAHTSNDNKRNPGRKLPAISMYHGEDKSGSKQEMQVSQKQNIRRSPFNLYQPDSPTKFSSIDGKRSPGKIHRLPHIVSPSRYEAELLEEYESPTSSKDDSRQRQIRELEIQNERLLKDLGNLYWENQDLTKRLETVTGSVAIESYNKVFAETKKLKAAEVSYQEQISDLNKEIADKRKIHEYIMSENKLLRRKLQRLQVTCTEHDQDSKNIISLQKKIGEKTVRNKERRENLALLINIKEELENEITTLKALVVDLRDKIDGLNIDLRHQKSLYSSRYP